MTIQTDTPHADFVGYQKDERVGGVRAWYIIKAPGYARHLSTVFAPTLVELGIPIPKHPPYFPNYKFDSVWVFKCENAACHISYLNKEVVIKHVEETKHYQIVQELVTITQVQDAKESGVVNKLPKKAIMIVKENQEATQELDEFVEPVEQKKPKIVLISDSGERQDFNSVKEMGAFKEVKTVAKVVPSKVVDYSKIEKKVFETVCEESFTKRMQAKFPDIPLEETKC